MAEESKKLLEAPDRENIPDFTQPENIFQEARKENRRAKILCGIRTVVSAGFFGTALGVIAETLVPGSGFIIGGLTAAFSFGPIYDLWRIPTEETMAIIERRHTQIIQRDFTALSENRLDLGARLRTNLCLKIVLDPGLLLAASLGTLKTQPPLGNLASSIIAYGFVIATGSSFTNILLENCERRLDQLAQKMLEIKRLMHQIKPRLSEKEYKEYFDKIAGYRSPTLGEKISLGTITLSIAAASAGVIYAFIIPSHHFTPKLTAAFCSMAGFIGIGIVTYRTSLSKLQEISKKKFAKIVRQFETSDPEKLLDKKPEDKIQKKSRCTTFLRYLLTPLDPEFIATLLSSMSLATTAIEQKDYPRDLAILLAFLLPGTAMLARGIIEQNNNECIMLVRELEEKRRELKEEKVVLKNNNTSNHSSSALPILPLSRDAAHDANPIVISIAPEIARLVEESNSGLPVPQT